MSVTLFSEPLRLLSLPGQSLAIRVLGLGKVESSEPAYDDFLDRYYVIYASLYESATYGNPAFWFTEPERLERHSNPAGSLISKPPQLTKSDTLRKVNLYDRSARVDITGLGRYSCHGVDERSFLILPDSF